MFSLQLLTLVGIISIYLSGFAGHYLRIRLTNSSINVRRSAGLLNTLLLVAGAILLCLSFGTTHFLLVYIAVLMLVFSLTYRFAR
jgi:hypothetical protein